MHETHFAPHPALLEYVDSVFDIDLQFVGTGLSPIYPFVPTHTRFLCFYLQDRVRVKKQTGDFEQRARSIIIGPQPTPVTLDFGECHRSIMVLLKPVGMYRLLGIPMRELVDCDFDARMVLGGEIDDLMEQLQEACSSAARNDIRRTSAKMTRSVGWLLELFTRRRTWTACSSVSARSSTSL